ncbi:MAG: TetR family transcriptional regulator [Planctomycetes bacterium]|nr:TetR family transcriptional regulator [Planctomycetota bacterium]
MPTTDTKDTILDAAETLFAEQGFAATSLRQLTARAGVNLAAVNYHFGSKEELVKAVLRRCIQPINDERRRLLDAITTPTLPAIMRAFVEPALRSAAGGDAADRAPAAGLARIFGRISVEQPPFLREFMAEQFGELGRRFVGMLRAAAPDLDARTTWMRMHFTVGAMAHTLQNAHMLEQISGGACAVRGQDELVDQLIAYAVGGFANAMPNAEEQA